jgi:hypothetical protein
VETDWEFEMPVVCKHGNAGACASTQPFPWGDWYFAHRRLGSGRHIHLGPRCRFAATHPPLLSSTTVPTPCHLRPGPTITLEPFSTCSARGELSAGCTVGALRAAYSHLVQRHSCPLPTSLSPASTASEERFLARSASGSDQGITSTFFFKKLKICCHDGKSRPLIGIPSPWISFTRPSR